MPPSTLIRMNRTATRMNRKVSKMRLGTLEIKCNIIDRQISQGFGRTKNWEVAKGCAGRSTRLRPALTAVYSGKFV